jgi:hypothetical protein
MLVWGAQVSGGGLTATGGQYDPAADAWTSNEHRGSAAVALVSLGGLGGNEMIVWGGVRSSGFAGE